MTRFGHRSLVWSGPAAGRSAARIAVLLLLLVLTGCEGAAAIVSVISGPDVVPAKYVLPDQTTAVLIDDPKHFLDNPSLARQIGTTAVHYLQRNDALNEAEFIEPNQVARLERQLSREWATTPIDQIGRELGADQVIYAKIVAASGQVEGDLFRPVATLEAKVIRSEDGKRLWPAVGPLTDPNAPATPGYRFTVEMEYHTRQGPRGSRGTPSDLQRRLADELGLKLARIFHDWKRPEPGETL